MKNNISDTIEIDAILEEARLNRTQVFDPQNVVRTQNVQPTPLRAPQHIPVIENSPKPQHEQVDISNAFIIYDEQEDVKKNKKGKESGLKIAMVLAILVFIFSAGFCAYTFLGDSTYANNVYVNDICLGGMNEEEAKTVLANEEKKLSDSISINVTAADKTTTLTKDDIDCTFNTEKVLNQAKRYSKGHLFQRDEHRLFIEPKLSDENLDKVVEKVATDLNQEPVSAKVTQFDSSKSGTDRFVFEDEKIGVEINAKGFQKQLKSLFSEGKVSGNIDAESEKTEPKYSKEFLQNSIKELCSYSTIATAPENSRANMKLAATMCNNSIINPGEVWSFNQCTGDSNLESNGYKLAGVLVNGQSAMGVGGGICQTSSTIYNAALYCGLHVQERRPHAIPSTYVPVGLDATIDYGNIDLKLKNTFDYQLFMECYMEGSTVVCKIYGLENSDFDEVEVTSSMTSGTNAVAYRTFYKNGKRVTGPNFPDEDLPPSSYDSSGGSSQTSDTNPETQSPSESTPVTPEPTPIPIPTPKPQPEPELPETQPYIPTEPDFGIM